MREGRFNVLFGGQCGSEAKGKMGAWLAQKFDIRNYAGCLSPNAGHTFIRGNDKVVTHHLPVSMMGRWLIAGTLEDVWVVCGPASVIRRDVLYEELMTLSNYGLRPQNVIVDRRAAVIVDGDMEVENDLLTRIGSTAQGVGMARSKKIGRDCPRMGDYDGEIEEMGVRVIDETDEIVLSWMREGLTTLFECGQGFDLCLEHGVDPVYCTSRIISPQAALADMGVPAKFLGDSYAVIRTYPIRVNNRMGSSGPYPSKELRWSEIQERCGADHDLTEITTTTKLPRRVFEFSMGQVARMVRVCDPTYLCLQFANYLDHGVYGKTVITSPRVMEFARELETQVGRKVAYIGTGPDHMHMVDRSIDQ